MGLNSYRPTFKVTANDRDITDAIARRFVSLRLTDETGFASDTLEITLADHDDANPLRVPSTGAELRVWIGYEGRLVNKGLFVCDEVELSGWPATMTLRARAAPYEGTPKGKRDLQTQKTRSWPVGTTVGSLVDKIAREHGMAAATSPELADVQLPHIDQAAESDMNFLIRLARWYDAVAKPAGGKLIFAKRGNAKTVSGASLPTITLRQGDVSDYRMTIARRDSPGTVVAFYRDARAAKRHQVSAGSGEPLHRIRAAFKNRDMAQAAVKAMLARRARGEHRLSLRTSGDPDITAEANLQLEEFRSGVAGDWLVTRVEHALDSQGGYTCTIDAEKPNSNPDVIDATSDEITDTAVQ